MNQSRKEQEELKHEVKVTLKLIQVYVTNKKGDLQRYKVSGPASVPNHRP
ncbi:MAG: hypothetical protein J7L72_12465 [Candidatus Aminicenantes bacterium]|nr:hypothetical protein [Candidatus Aminicenantes bacterium]